MLLAVLASTLVACIGRDWRRFLFSSVFGATVLSSYVLIFPHERYAAGEMGVTALLVLGAPVLFGLAASFMVARAKATEYRPTNSTPRPFSWAWFGCAGLIHLLVTVALTDLFLLASVVDGIEDVGSELQFYEIVLWGWTPGAALAAVSEKSEVFTAFAACMTSLLAGLACGFRGPRFVSWLASRFPGIAIRFARPSARFRALAVPTIVILAIGCIAGTLHARFARWETRFSLRDHFKLRPFASQIRNAKSFRLFEGLPHQFSEAVMLRSELASKDTFRIWEFDFYSAPVPTSPSDLQVLTRLASSSDTYVTFGGPKLCGGFHPDFALTWNDGTKRTSLLLCLGCSEMLFINDDRKFLVTIRHEFWEQFRDILDKYHPNRPMR